MNVASLELCKELYKLSGWNDTHAVWYWYEDYDCIDDSYDKATCRQSMDDRKAICPAYDLGYLLRKLPHDTRVEKLYTRQFDKDFYVASRVEHKGTDYESALNSGGDTPEDALCELAVELFKQGVLVKEEVPTNE